MESIEIKRPEGKASRIALLNSTMAKVSPLGELTIALFNSAIPFKMYLYINLYLVIFYFPLSEPDKFERGCYMEHYIVIVIRVWYYNMFITQATL